MLKKEKIDCLLPWGSQAEFDRATAIVAAAGYGRVLPRLSLTQLKDTLAQATGAVTVDTGLGHLSAALNLTTVALYSTTDPEKIGTLGENQTHIMMSAAAPERIVKALGLVK